VAAPRDPTEEGKNNRALLWLKGGGEKGKWEESKKRKLASTGRVTREKGGSGGLRLYRKKGKKEKESQAERR